MNDALLIAISGIVGFVSKSLWDIFAKRIEANRLRTIKRKETLDETFKKFSKPILLAAADLQDRLWHLTQEQANSQNPILLKEDLDAPKSPTWQMTKRHYLVGTIYLFARYFAWVEILKTKAQFIELGESEFTKKFSNGLKQIERKLAQSYPKENFKEKITSDRQLFQLQQAYIGEKLMVEKAGELSCLGFAEFYDKYDEQFAQIEEFKSIEELVTKAVSKNPKSFSLGRCCLLLNALVDLIDFLDPEAEYISRKDRERVKVVNWKGI